MLLQAPLMLLFCRNDLRMVIDTITMKNLLIIQWFLETFKCEINYDCFQILQK